MRYQIVGGQKQRLEDAFRMHFGDCEYHGRSVALYKLDQRCGTDCTTPSLDCRHWIAGDLKVIADIWFLALMFAVKLTVGC